MPQETVYVVQRIAVHQTFNSTTLDWAHCGFLVKTNSAYGWSGSPVIDQRGYVVGMLRGRNNKNTIIITSENIRHVLEVIYPCLEGAGIKRFLTTPSTLLRGEDCKSRPLSCGYNIRKQGAFLPRRAAWTRSDTI